MLTSYASGISYNVAGQVTAMTSGSGVVENYMYSNDRLQLTRQTATKSGSTLMDLNYNYTAAAGASGVGTSAGNSGQLMAISSTPASTINGQPRNQAFSYDDLGRLVTATGWSAWQRRFDYDRWNNRTGVWDATLGGNQIQSVVREMSGGAPTNRLTSITNSGVPATQTYDASGNLTNDGAHTYQYDAEGRIASVDTSGASYSYDSANRRVKKVAGTGTNAVTTYYVWEGAQVIAEYSNAPAGTGGTSYYLADRLSTRMTTDSNGTFKGTQDHLPFGEEAGTSGTTEKHRFTNYERDGESTSDYAMNRQYGSGAGRFMRPDPISGSVASPQNLNRYSYTTGDPVNAIDPLGLEKCTVSDGKGGWIEIPCPNDDPPIDPNDHEIVLRGDDNPYLPDWQRRSYSLFIDGGFVMIGGPSIGPGTAPTRSSGDARLVSGGFNICGAMASYGQYSNYNFATGAWKGWPKNGPTWYGRTFHGNQYLSSAAVRSYAQGFKVLGRASFAIGAAFSVSQGFQSYQEGNYGFANNGSAKSGLDIVMGGVGVAGGPVGATASGVYFGVDMTVGWGAVGREAQKQAPAQCTSPLGGIPSVWLPRLF